MGLEVTTEKYLIMNFLIVRKGFQGKWLASSLVLPGTQPQQASCVGGTCAVPGMVHGLSSTQPPTLKMIKEMTP